MHEGRRIINIDEAVIHTTDSRRRGWMRKGQLNQVTGAKRVAGVNLIAALTSDGELLYTVNCGITNTHTFGYYLTRLCAHLDHDEPNWRLRTVIMLDNAVFHRTKQTGELIRELKLPVLYLGPYHFRMAPIEMVFNYIKSRELKTFMKYIFSK